jgi:hypothetical protein
MVKKNKHIYREYVQAAIEHQSLTKKIMESSPKTLDAYNANSRIDINLI